MVALRVEDLAETPEGLRVVIHRSKTDQEGAGQEIAILRGLRLRPALRAWLDAARMTSGSVFRQDAKDGRVTADALAPETVADIVKARAAPIGIRSRGLRGPQPARRVSDQRRRGRRVDLQADGGLAPQERGHATRLRPPRRAVQGPRGERVPVRPGRRATPRPRARPDDAGGERQQTVQSVPTPPAPDPPRKLPPICAASACAICRPSPVPAGGAAGSIPMPSSLTVSVQSPSRHPKMTPTRALRWDVARVRAL